MAANEPIFTQPVIAWHFLYRTPIPNFTKMRQMVKLLLLGHRQTDEVSLYGDLLSDH